MTMTLHLQRAETFAGRLLGLLGLPPLRPGQALYLAPCSGIHTFFMRYAIDVAFVDRKGRVLKLVTVQPWRAAACRGAHGALETRAGEAPLLGVALGEQVRALIDTPPKPRTEGEAHEPF